MSNIYLKITIYLKISKNIIDKNYTIVKDS